MMTTIHKRCSSIFDEESEENYLEVNNNIDYKVHESYRTQATKKIESDLNYQLYDAKENKLYKTNGLRNILEKINLPEFINEEYLAEVITACILKKAFLATSNWTKWILLAALEELYGRSAPTLSETQLKDLQQNANHNDQNLAYSCSNVTLPNMVRHGFDTTSEVGTEAPKTPISEINHLEVPPSSSGKNGEYTFSEKSGYEKPTVGDFAVQCTPLELRILKNKKSQTKERRHHSSKQESGTQTFLSLSDDVKKNQLITHVLQSKDQKKPHDTKLACDTTSQSTQTEITTADKGIQTTLAWRLVKMSLTQKSRTPNSTKKYFNIGSEVKSLNVFHGKPLIGTTSKLQPPIIPLEPIFSSREFLENVLSDPRKKSSDSFSVNGETLVVGAHDGTEIETSSIRSLEYNTTPSTSSWAMNSPDVNVVSMDIEDSFSS